MFSNIFRVLGVVTVCLGLASCMTEEKYKAFSTALQGSASLKAKAVEICLGKPLDWNSDAREGIATIVSAADAKNPRMLCQRFVNSIASGKLKYQDYMSFKNEELAPNAIKVLQGK